MVATTKTNKNKINRVSKPRKLTESSKNFTFKSFKDRVDSIKIEPSLNLSTRVYDDVEQTSSHFISTLLHWKEVNLSGNFTDFAYEVDPVTKSLHQVIYHQDKIFEALYNHIEKYDPHSIQPLLELLTQFIHDLGPDFMKFYSRSLQLLTTISLNVKINDLQNNVASSNLLEWIFNNISFMFKYLSKDLNNDFRTTFEILLPTLSVSKQQYLARFCSEALSYLIKKMKPAQLNDTVTYLLLEKSQLIESNITFKDSLIVLFTQSITSTKESFHSKGPLIFQKLTDISFKDLKTNVIMTGVLSNIIFHGTKSSTSPFFETTVDSIDERLSVDLEESDFNQVIEILIALVFSDSGKKISNWDSVSQLFLKVVKYVSGLPRPINIDSFLFAFSLFIRNGDTLMVNKIFKDMLKFIQTHDHGYNFIPFIQSTYEVCGKNLTSLNISKHFQEFVNEVKDFKILQQLSLFRAHKEIKFSLPESNGDLIIKSLNLEDTTMDNLIDIFWKLNLLREGTIPQLNELILNVSVDDLFMSDFIGLCLSFVTPTPEVNQFLRDNFETLMRSSKFLHLFTDTIPEFEEETILRFVSSVANNLSVGDNQLRITSADFIVKCFKQLDIPCPEFISSIKVIETMPLTLNTARDIQLRIRLLCISFQLLEGKTPTDCKIISNYLFGLLQNRFQPCWQAVFENLERVIETCDGLVWDLCHKFISMDYNNQSESTFGLDYEEDTVDSLSLDVDLLFNDERIATSFNHSLRQAYQPFRTPVQATLRQFQESSTKLTSEDRVRGLAVEALNKIPSLAEANSGELLSFVLEDEKTLGWTLKDRNSLLTVFTKFKSLKALPGKDLLYVKLLDMLTSQRLASQKLALDVILNFKKKSVNKYRDNLKNLLDDTLFKDELTKLITNEDDFSIEDEDQGELMPLILRILFGRVQGGSRSNSKNAKKNAVIGALPILTQDQVTAFLKLGTDKIGFEDLETVEVKDFQTLKRMNGYVTLLSELYSVLGHNFKEALSTSIAPLIYCMSVSQLRISQQEADDMDVDEDNEEEDIEDEDSLGEERNEIKTAKRIRQLGMRCLNELFKLYGSTYDWEQHFESIYNHIVSPRLVKFDQENLQQPSSLLNILVSWIRIPGINKFVLFDNMRPAKAIISLLDNRKAKDSVLAVALGFAIDCLKIKTIDKENEDDFFMLLALVVEALLRDLSPIITNTLDADLINKSVTILLLLIDGEYISDEATKGSLIDSLINVFNKPPNKISLDDRERILISLSVLIADHDVSFDQFLSHFKVLSKSFRIYKEKNIRNGLVDVFTSIGTKFPQFEDVARVLKGLNSYTINGERLGEPNFEEILAAYKEINQTLYKSMSPYQWLPIIYCSLFFINDEEELAIRTNANYVLNHFVDCFSGLESADDASEYIKLLKNIILPDLREGLKLTNEVVQTEYIHLLSYIVENSKHFEDLNDMKVLLMDNDDEASFFSNINHIQLHRRQRAIRRVAEFRGSLKPGSISHYILPLIENYVFNVDEKLRNVSNEAIVTLGLLIRNVSWNQLRSTFKRFTAKLRVAKPETLKSSVNIVVEVSKALLVVVEIKRSSESSDVDDLKEFPKDPETLDSFILQELVPPLQRVLNERNDETIVNRITLSEALVCLVKCISEQKIDENLPGVLTSTCQVLRSRSEELRDAARKSLCKIAKSLGAKYFKFMLQELKSALTRGSQIHVLSFTMHALLTAIEDTLTHGDLDESINLAVEIIMEDTFGAAGQEKDAEGYTSKMKEVKHKKSYDSGEILTSKISLSEFNKIIDPIKLILSERISLRIQNKLDELLRRYALGLNHNEEASSKNILILSFQINRQAQNVFQDDGNKLKNQKVNDKYNNDDNKDHFLIKLNSKFLKTQVDFNQYKYTLQKFSFELLRAAISRHESLLAVSSMQQFIPLLEDGLNSDHEGLISTCLRLLHTIIRLPFPEETNQIFKRCSRKALNLIKDSPNTTSDICQSSLKFLATLIRHKSEVSIKDTSISYVLERIQPDLEEPKTQGLAFNFLKSVVSQHILLPEVYDIMEVVAKIMVVNHNREIRDMARSIYFQFLMEYDQGRGKLEKQFKFLVNNLSYATQDGRQSVLELVNSIVSRSGEDLLNKISTSFFVALANVLVSDDSSKCREMASLIILSIFKNLEQSKLANLEKYFVAWLKQDANHMLLRCGLNVYKIYMTHFGLSNSQIDELAFEKIHSICRSSNAENLDETENEDVEWQLVYSALNVFQTICSKEKVKIVSSKYEHIWKAIINTLLFPHSWVRLSASRLVAVLIANVDNCDFTVSDYEIQTVAYRMLRQLAAPQITEDLGTQAVKTLINVATRWEKNQTKYVDQSSNNDLEPEDEEEEVPVKFELANEFLISRACYIIRQYSTSLTSKKVAIKLCAMLTQVVTGDLIPKAAEQIILSLFPITENNNSNADPDLLQLATECVQIIETKLGGSEYIEIYSKVQKIVNTRRQERRTKRAQLAITNPDVSAKRKMKKHARFREKRKHDKDENGYYHSKKRRY